MDFKKLKMLMVDRDTNCRQLARLIGMNQVTFYNKINGKREFSREELERIIIALKIDQANIAEYFFSL